MVKLFSDEKCCHFIQQAITLNRSVGRSVGNSGHYMINFLSNCLMTLSSHVVVTLKMVTG